LLAARLNYDILHGRFRLYSQYILARGATRRKRPFLGLWQDLSVSGSFVPIREWLGALVSLASMQQLDKHTIVL